MNLKKILSILFILICCGCNAKYELDFTDDKIVEKLTVSTNSNNMSNEDIYEKYNKSITTIGGKNYYNFEIKENKNDSLKLNYNYEFNTSNFNTSYITKNCFSTFKFANDEEKYYILAQGNFKCLYYQYAKLDSLDVSIKTNHNVIENNADEVKNNEYIWHIDLNNIENINIKLITDNKVSKQSKKEKNTIKYK